MDNTMDYHICDDLVVLSVTIDLVDGFMCTCDVDSPVEYVLLDTVTIEGRETSISGFSVDCFRLGIPPFWPRPFGMFIIPTSVMLVC